MKFLKLIFSKLRRRRWTDLNPTQRMILLSMRKAD
jgi:hypothetical protein